MMLPSLRRSLSARSRRSPAASSPRKTCKPGVEPLEDRTVPAGWAFVTDSPISTDGPSTADAAGNVYVAGGFTGTADFDPGPGTFQLTSAGSTDVYVAKYRPDGSLAWARQAGGATDEGCHGLAVDAAGNVTVAGAFSGTADFDPGPGTLSLSSAGGSDVFVWQLDAQGNLRWARRAGGTGWDDSRSLKADAAGNVYLTGLFTGTANFGATNLVSAGAEDVFVCKLDPSGNFAWAQRMGGATHDQGNQTALFNAPEGLQVFVTGAFTGTAGFGSTTLVDPGNTDAFLCKLDAATGSFLTFAATETQALQFGGADWATGVGLVIDSTGKTYLSGQFGGTADFDPGLGPATMTAPPGLGGYFVELGAAGNYVRSWIVGDGGGRLVVDANNNLYATAPVPANSTFDLDPGPGTAYLTGDSVHNGFVFKLDGAGNFVAAWRFNHGSYVSIYTDPVDGPAFYTTGGMNGTSVFDTGTAEIALTGNGLAVCKTVEATGGVLGQVFADLDRDGAFGAGEVPLQGWTVYADLDSDGVLDAGEPSTTSGGRGEYYLNHLLPGSYTIRQVGQAGWSPSVPGGQTVTLAAGQFVTGKDFGNTTTPTSRTYGNTTAKNLPSQGTTTSTITVGDAYNILDLNLKLNVSHKSDDQLDIFLIGPDGTRVELTTDNGGSGDNYTTTTFDDEAGTAITAGAAPFNGSYRPEGPLSAFDGKRLNGTWTLEITDDTAGTAGKLNSWSLIVTGPSGSPLLAAGGAVAGGPGGGVLTEAALQPLVREATRRWQASGLSADQVRALRDLDVQVADLGGATLGLASGNAIWLDDNAAGWGWFVDRTPRDDSEFTTPGDQGEQGRMDLLTALTHEMGHILGLDHDAGGVMQETLAPGTRLSPPIGVTAAAITGSIPSGPAAQPGGPWKALAAPAADSRVVPFKVSGGGTAPQGLPVFPGGTAPHNATGTATHLGKYSGEGVFTLLGFTSATTGTFTGTFVFVAANGDRLAFNYGATTPGTFTVTPTGEGKVVVRFVAEFTPDPAQSTGRFAKVTGGSFTMIATTEPFGLQPNDQGYTVPFAYTWVGDGWLEFGEKK
jgi:subtilisin-like proprotein convertase family protein